MIGHLARAAEAGYTCGLERRRPSAKECAEFAATWASFARGRRRGLAAAAKLQQQKLELTAGQS